MAAYEDKFTSVWIAAVRLMIEKIKPLPAATMTQSTRALSAVHEQTGCMSPAAQ